MTSPDGMGTHEIGSGARSYDERLERDDLDAIYLPLPSRPGSNGRCGGSSEDAGAVANMALIDAVRAAAAR